MLSKLLDKAFPLDGIYEEKDDMNQQSKSVKQLKGIIDNFLPILFARYFTAGDFHFSEVRQDDALFIMRAISKSCTNQYDLYQFYKWMGVNAEWIYEAPYKNLPWYQFKQVYVNNHKHITLLYRILNDFRRLLRKNEENS